MGIYGHRGWSHSILFALIFWTCMGYWLSQKTPTMRRQLMGWMILATLSHPFLDMLTAGGLGVVLFFPFFIACSYTVRRLRKLFL